MKKSNNKMTRYDLWSGWHVTVEETPTEFNAWLNIEGYGVADYMFGSLKENWHYDGPVTITKKEFLEMVSENARDYIRTFCEKYPEAAEVQFRHECEEIADRLSAKGKPSYGTDYDLQVEDLRRWYEEQYPEAF